MKCVITQLIRSLFRLLNHSPAHSLTLSLNLLLTHPLLSVQDVSVWRQVEDPSCTPGLEFSWAASDLYTILLQTLNIDTRSMVIIIKGYFSQYYNRKSERKIRKILLKKTHRTRSSLLLEKSTNVVHGLVI